MPELSGIHEVMQRIHQIISSSDEFSGMQSKVFLGEFDRRKGLPQIAVFAKPDAVAAEVVFIGGVRETEFHIATRYAHPLEVDAWKPTMSRFAEAIWQMTEAPNHRLRTVDGNGLQVLPDLAGVVTTRYLGATGLLRNVTGGYAYLDCTVAVTYRRT